jgi:uncharacterized protein
MQNCRKWLFLVIMGLLLSCTKEKTALSGTTTEFFIDSKFKEKTYRIWVHLPEGYDASGNQRYATLYVLDPDDELPDNETNFTYLARLCAEISRKRKTDNVIAIGIRYGDYRETDYTPTKTNIGEGGSPKFLRFIESELIPKVQATYRADTSRMSRIIIGHSLGGLCGAHAFTQFNAAFGHYLLLSATMMYDDEVVLQYEQKARAQLKNQPQLVYLGVGGTEPNMFPLSDALYRRLKAHYPKAKTAFEVVPGKGHNTSKQINFEKAIRYYFNNR